MDSFDISSDSEEGLLDEIVVGYNCHQQHFPKIVRREYFQQQQHSHYQNSYTPDYHHQNPPYQKQHHQQQQEQQQYGPLGSPIHFCNNSHHSDDNSFSAQENSQQQQDIGLHSSSGNSNISNKPIAGVTMRSTGSSTSVGSTMTAPTTTISSHDASHIGTTTVTGQLELEALDTATNNKSLLATTGAAVMHQQAATSSATSTSNHSLSATSAAASFNHQLTADMCSYKNSKSRRLEYSLKCMKYGRSNPSQDSAFGSLTDGDLSTGSSSFRLNSFQSISSPIDEGVEDIIVATTTAGHETCLELATIPSHMVSQDSAISSPCRESSPSNFLTIDDATSGSCSAGSSSSGSIGNVRPQQFPVSLSPKILVTATTNSSNSSLASSTNAQQLQQFDPPKILVNDQNSIYTTSPSKRSGTIEVFSQKYRVSSYEDMSPNKRSSSAGSEKHLKNANRMAFRSLEEERRIDSAFMPITDRTSSENRVNMQSEKYKKLTHASFRISKTSSQMNVLENTQAHITSSPTGSTSTISTGNIAACAEELSRPATASGSTSSRQTLWRDSKFYRKNRIAKSNDSLLETSPNHSARLSPSSLRDNHYGSCSSYGSAHSSSRQSLNRGCSVNEISGSNQTLGIGLAVTMSLRGSSTNNKRYCSSKSEDLGESSDYLQAMDTRKSYSERHLVSLTKLKQSAITTAMGSNEQSWQSEDELNFSEDRQSQYSYEQQQRYEHQQKRQRQHQKCHKQHQSHSHHGPDHHYQNSQQHGHARPHPNQLSLSTCSINRITTTKIRTTSLATLSCHPNSEPAKTTVAANTNTMTTMSASSVTMKSTVFKSLDHALNLSEHRKQWGTKVNSAEENSSTDDSPSHRVMSSAELSRIFAADETQGGSCSEEKTPLLDSVEMSPISPSEPTHDHNVQI